MVYSLYYRRPARVESTVVDNPSIRDPTSRSTTSGSSGVSRGIPNALSFDKIIENGTCPPCTVRDFMNYLKYIEYAAENLQFFLWYKDYCKRFDQLDGAKKALAPVWTAAQVDAETTAAQSLATSQSKSRDAAAVFGGTIFATGPKSPGSEPAGDPFATPPRSAAGDSRTDLERASVSVWEVSSVEAVSESTKGYSKAAAGAFENANLNWQPFTIQPFRDEIARIIATYIAEGSPRELNLSARERIAVLHALRNTTHPSTLTSVMKSVEESLRYQAHPNFIRWTICNGNRPRVIFARCLGVGGIIFGSVAALLLTLSRAGRGWRALAAIGWMIGFATLVAAWKGMCVVLHGMHHRHLRPWELFVKDNEGPEYELKKDSLDSTGTGNSYEDEPWVVKYEKRNIVRKIFDREVWIQEPALRQIQDTIFVQAVLSAFVVTAILTGIFVAIPRAGMF
ncbi:hypothetical protein FGG08_005301 [Glutinoglossum americanum]|uniref:Regulator of G protein signaling superfamily n=1 Tax=Glutinoglossum americanum TaxID=1670608 RepID=A0A9P8I7I3_9PEZI|nr:hypothetical protein FGG08_005301 [Glutinoglossum americanum]